MLQFIHSKNSISNSVGNAAIDNADTESEIKIEIKKIEAEIIVLKSKIEDVYDRLEGLKYKEKEILTAYYIEGCSCEDIGNRVYYMLFHQTRTDKAIQKIIQKATEKMLNL